MTKDDKKGIYRNLTSYGDIGFSKYMRRAFLAAAGYDREDTDRPIIGIVDTRSDFNPCHRDLGQVLEAIKRGVIEAGGLPMVFPTISLNEIFVSPTTMLYRNLLAMETEEMVRSQPMDAVVMTGGCDKTIPAQLMAAASADIPAICVPPGPMRTGYYKGERLGACTDCRRLWAEYRAGEIDEEEISVIEKSLCPTGGTCMVMGTASTMACLSEAMGMTVPGGAAAPSGSGDRLRAAVLSGRVAVEAAGAGRRPSSILTESAFHNALTVLGAVSGSTNAVVHLTAIAGRRGITLDPDRFHDVASRTPLLTDCKPAGSLYLEDFHNAGGMPALLKALEPLLKTDTPTVTGKTLAELLKTGEGPGEWQSVIRTLENPLGPAGTIVTVRGTLAPDGAVIKAAAASKELFEHEGPAVVFDSPEDMAARIDGPDLPVTADSVLVLRNAGPFYGMPEAGYIPIPRKLAREGVKDMVRISDARMSGTAFGTIVLHCAPESAVGGPLAMVKDGDAVRLDVKKRRLDLLVDEPEIARRKKAWTAPVLPSRGWKLLHARHVLQANKGADLDFL